MNTNERKEKGNAPKEVSGRKKPFETIMKGKTKETRRDDERQQPTIDIRSSLELPRYTGV